MSGAIFQPTLWLAHLRLARISNLPTILTNVLAAAVLAGVGQAGQVGSLTVILVLVALAMALFYTAGMYLNDYCDYRIDCRQRPERPLPSGVLQPWTVLVFALAYFGLGLLLLAFTRWEALLSGVLLVAVIIGYDRWHKQNPLAHLVMALARGLVYVTTFLACGGTRTAALLLAAGLLCLYVAGVTYIARSETRADFTRYWPMVLLVMPAVTFGRLAPVSFLPVMLLFLLWCLVCLRYIYRRTDTDIGGGIARLVAGIALFDAMVAAVYGALWWPVLLCGALFVLTRLLQRYIAGS